MRDAGGASGPRVARREAGGAFPGSTPAGAGFDRWGTVLATEAGVFVTGSAGGAAGFATGGAATTGGGVTFAAAGSVLGKGVFGFEAGAGRPTAGGFGLGVGIGTFTAGEFGAGVGAQRGGKIRPG